MKAGRRLASFPLAGLVLSLALGGVEASQVLELYRVKHRPAGELVEIAQTGMGNDGQVTLDARTATLILNGSEAAVRRALRLLAQVDRPLRTVVLNSQVRERAELERMGVEIDWGVAAGPMRIGRLPGPATGVLVSAGGRRESRQTRSGSRLRVLEGSTGVIQTGTALPFVYQPHSGARAVEFLPVDTGLQATATVLGDGRVQVELHPFSGRVDTGAPRYTMAATTVTLSPGETMAIGGTSTASEGSEAGLTGAAGDRERSDSVVLVTVEVEEP